MALATIVEGKDFMLFTGTTTKKPIALATSCKVTINHSPKEISSKDSGIWTDLSPGKLKWSASTDALLSYDATIQSYEYFYDLMIARTPVTLTFAVAGGTSPAWTVSTTKDQYLGEAYITSLDLTAGDSENVTYSVSLDGTGALTKTQGV